MQVLINRVITWINIILCYFILIAFLDLAFTSKMFLIFKTILGIITLVYGLTYSAYQKEKLLNYLKIEEKKKQEKIKRNLILDKQKRYYQFKGNINTILPDINFIENDKKVYLNNDERMEYLNNLILSIKQINEDAEFKNMNIILQPHLELINNIFRINNEIKHKINIDVLEDLNIHSKIMNINNILHNYNNYLRNMSEVFKNDYFSIKVGIEGEEAVNRQLAIYNDILHNYSNVRFEVDGISIENDNLIVSPFGVFSLEVKNLGITSNFSIKIEKDGRWKRIYNNGREEIMKNITEQTYRHVGLVQKMINNKLKEKGYSGEYIQVQTLIVFANENVNIINDSDIPVLRVSNIYHSIVNNSKQKLDENIIKLILEIIEEERLELKKYEIDEISEYLKNLAYTLNEKMINYNQLYTQLQSLNNLI
ncbi:nuclease-related domain-containing protein [Caloramator sp. E03]|uniref:nuclease-related domain-containing protein n=1 Tax=Caloramator sp. E03 TaxID=2576307 RepID=UPI00143D0515|nr:nuclease-related domain-containing protein [Caloramator sp. E03]